MNIYDKIQGLFGGDYCFKQKTKQKNWGKIDFSKKKNQQTFQNKNSFHTFNCTHFKIQIFI